MGRTKKEEHPENEIKKVRKVHSGLLKDKSRTMARLVAAVGKVIQKHGYPGLTLANIERETAINRKVVYTYFGSLDSLIETYIREKDFWKFGGKKAITKMLEEPDLINKNDIYSLLEGQFDALFSDRAYQRIIHWELGENHKVLKNIADKREALGEQVFEIISTEFDKASVDIRARLALQIGGIYYLTLHAKSNGSTVCGIDINEEAGRERIKEALKQIIDEAYVKAGIG